ncbi:uncharacterized protein LOC143374759 isoform X3 [Andrena cerasifolii]|uniref:uncharacterized protein LOC143374759 isoform X3 n=1 Tax=Andrena cerasifolii TaxID=2819439 RepID=UPI004037669B
MFTESGFRSFAFFLIFFHTIQSSTTISQKFTNNKFPLTICHRKLQPGKKMVELLVERVLTCENVQECRRACDHEKAFACKGFNHRRGTNGSNDTCELTSTPYFRMNGDRDFLIDSRYDYYEKDPTCLPSVRPGGTVRWMDRVTVYGQNSQDTWSPLDREDGEFIRSFTGDRVRSNQQFPQEDRRDFASRQNAPTWNGNYWRGSEARYSSTVNDDMNPLHDSSINYNEQHSSTRSSTLSKSRLGDRSLPRGFFTPRKDEEFYRKFDDYGIAFGYNDNYMPKTKEFPYGEQKRLPVTSKCSIRLAAGSKLSRNVLRKTCLARDSRQCEDFCINEITFPCGSFAYRYNLVTPNPTDNCLLSDVPYENLNFYTDLEPDRDYDSWIISHDSKVCRSKGTTNRYSSEECFLRVRSGFSMPTDITKKSMLVDDLGGCQFACTMSHEFLCRSFAFKYATEDRDRAQERASPNCLMSDWPSVGINPVDMPDVDGAELYERISFPSGCEPPITIANSPLPITDIQLPPSTTAEPKDKQSAPADVDEICYSQYHRACKLMPHAIVSSTRAATKSECCQKCSTMRNIGSIPCMSFNYMVHTVDTRDNCLLSIISVRDLRPNLDYTYDDDQVLLYMWKDLDPYCSLTVNSLNSPSTAAAVPEEHGEPFSPPASQMNTAQGVPDTATGTFQQIFFHSVPPTRSVFGHENHECNYKRNHAMCNYDVGSRLVSDGFEHRFSTPHPRDLSIFRRYTVNGHPCKNGSVCQRNEIAGYWSCEIEENEQGAGMEPNWDYCCEPNHRCGFSQGYHYPWCYVGSNDDQWRPCSETYYPYPHYLPLPRDYHSLNSELSAFSRRHWPIIYLHETLPPNCTVGN